jgi:hypothetical protein
MTYNFDADRWYENQRAILDGRKARGELDEQAFQRELERLGERYDDMVNRMAGPFELPPRRPDREAS